jgi:hypothetical protein
MPQKIETLFLRCVSVLAETMWKSSDMTTEFYVAFHSAGIAIITSNYVPFKLAFRLFLE